MMRPLTVALAVAACGSTAATPLIDLPEFTTTSATVGRGELAQFEVTNSTTSEVVLESPVCATRLERFSGGQWFPAEPTNPECVGIPLTLAVGAGHQFGYPAPASQVGRFRAVMHGTNADGTFVVRSNTFLVD